MSGSADGGFRADLAAMARMQMESEMSAPASLVQVAYGAHLL